MTFMSYVMILLVLYAIVNFLTIAEKNYLRDAPSKSKRPSLAVKQTKEKGRKNAVKDKYLLEKVG